MAIARCNARAPPSWRDGGGSCNATIPPPPLPLPPPPCDRGSPVGRRSDETGEVSAGEGLGATTAAAAAAASSSSPDSEPESEEG